jgi:hypothetical protein
VAGFGAARPPVTSHAASLTTPESRQTDAPDAWFDHAAGAIIVRKTYRLPIVAGCQVGVGH